MSLQTTLLAAAVALLSVALPTAASAQRATNALGLRVDDPFIFEVGGGGGSGYYGLPHLSYKRYLTERDAVEAALGYRRIWYRAEDPSDDFFSQTTSSQVSYQRYVAFGGSVADDPAPLRWYYGGGLRVSFSKSPYTIATLAGDFEFDNKSTSYSAFGLIGLAYRPRRIPLEFSLDTGPAFTHVVDSDSTLSDFGTDDDSSRSYFGSTAFSLGARWTFGGKESEPADAN